MTYPPCTITVNMRDSNGESCYRRILAMAHSEHIAVNPEPMPEVDVDFWNVTHRPTGLAFVRGLSEEDAHACAEEIVATGRDLSTTDPLEFPKMDEVKAIAMKWRDKHRVHA